MNDPISKLSYLLGHLRGLFLPFGLFALVAVGVHVGCDRLDDHAFVLLNLADRVFDEGSSWLIHAIGELIGASAATLDGLALRAAELVDLERKEWLARVVALILELGTDVVLALPVFVYRSLPSSLGELWALVTRSVRDLTLLRIAAPSAAVAATTAGAFAIAREVQVAAHALASGAKLEADHAALAASIAGFLALALVAWRLAWVVVIGAATYADRRAANDRTMLVLPRKRRLRGLATALIALPITFTALAATPIAGTLRALLWM